MRPFDAQVQRVTEYVESMRAQGRPTREFTVPRALDDLRASLPIRVGAGANPKIILRSETHVELGSPEAGSCAMVLWTDRPSMIRDGAITLIGPDVGEAAGSSLPFGQIVLVGGAELGPDEHQSIGHAQYVADQIEGYMVRSSSRSIWSRVSTEAARKGFSFDTLGRSLMVVFKSSLPKVQAMEVVFVTSSKDDVLRLNDIAQVASDIGAEIVKEHWKARGFDLECDLDCRSCHDKDVCDDVRKILAGRLKKKRTADAQRAS